MTTTVEDLKKAAAEAAVAEVRDGMLLGLGTGSTAAFAIEAVARRVRDEGLRIRAVATSERTSQQAAGAGIDMLDMGDIAAVDLAIDGVDEIDPAFRAIKGAGGAMLREKVVASAAARMVAIADASKPVVRLGAKPVPVEVLPLARAFAASRIGRLGGEALLRMAGDAAARTDQGNIILDCHFRDLADPDALAANLSIIPGILGHGLFLTEIDALYLGTADGVTCTERHPVAGNARD